MLCAIACVLKSAGLASWSIPRNEVFARFYARYGFRPLLEGARMILPLAEAERLLAES